MRRVLAKSERDGSGEIKTEDEEKEREIKKGDEKKKEREIERMIGKDRRERNEDRE